MRTKIFLITVILLNFGALTAQETSEAAKYTDKIVFSGLLKARAVYDLEDEQAMFNIRNARVGFRGLATEKIGYHVQLDLCDDGKFTPLDLAIKLFPLKNWDISFGQVTIPYSSQKILSPTACDFTDRSMLIKYVHPSSRDIGVNTTYHFENKFIPVLFQAGVYNGRGINNPQWTNSLAYAFRLAVGSLDNIRIVGKMANNFIYSNAKTDIIGAEVNAKWKALRLDVAFDQRTQKDTLTSKYFGFDVQCTYKIDLKNSFKYIMPTVRWDGVLKSECENSFDMRRLSLGVNLGFSEKYMAAELRLNYEKYFRQPDLAAIYTEKAGRIGVNDKIVLELLVKI